MSGLGPMEIILILLVFLVVVVAPVAIIIALVLFFVKRGRHSKADVKKCTFCGYSIPVDATFCGICGRELVTTSTDGRPRQG